MLQDIRKSAQGTAAKIIIGLIVIAFAGFGVESILLGGGSNAVAEVNGEEISPLELQRAVELQQRRLLSMMGENFDPSLLDEQQLSAQALDTLIGRKLLQQRADEMGLVVSEAEIASLVAGMPTFQIDGAFSPEAYKSVLAEAGYTPSSFKQTLRGDMVVNQLQSGLAGSEFATPAEVALNAGILAQQRDLRYFTVPREMFADVAAPTDEQIRQYYDSHQDAFLSPESVDLDFIEVSAEDFYAPVEERALREAYEIASQDYAGTAQSRVSHILFDDSGDEDITGRLAAVQARLAAGEDFADLAREFSDDAGSAGQGGDLGFTSGDVFPEAMEKAIAALSPGVVSSPVETDAGTHLLLVTERNETEIPAFEEMREELEARIQAEESRVELLRNIETLRDLAFTAAGLEEPASELDLAVERADGITRSQAEGLFAHPALLEAAFSEDVLEGGHNSEVVELANNVYVVLRVRAHHAARTRPLEEVRDQVVTALRQEAIDAAVTQEAARALRALRAGTDMESYAAEQGYQWQVELAVDRRNQTLPPEVLRRAFTLAAPDAGHTSSDYVLSQSGDALVIEVTNVTEGDYAALPAEEQQQLDRLIYNEYGTMVSSGFESGLRQGAEIKVL